MMAIAPSGGENWLTQADIAEVFHGGAGAIGCACAGVESA